MPEIRKILYVHGMGGGGDSRIPSILRERLDAEYARLSGNPSGEYSFQVICRTYDFDPEVAQRQLAAWAREVHPDLVIGESMGAVHAISLSGYPHIFVSPSLNAPFFFRVMAGLARIPGMTWVFDRRFHPKEGDRQRLHFSSGVLRKWSKVRAVALQNTTRNGSEDFFYAFFGSRDHYRRSGVVLIRTWRKYFGPGTWTVYRGSHFMEEEYVVSLLIPKIYSTLGLPVGA